MKYASRKEIISISTIVVILMILGVKNGANLITSLKPLVNLPKIAFAGFLSFAIVGVIMAIGNKIGIWFGKAGGSILYGITLFILGLLIF